MSANHPVKRSPSLLCVSIWESVRSDESSHCKNFVGGSESQKSSWSQEVYLFGESWALISSWLQEVCSLIRKSTCSDENSWPQGVCWSIGGSESQKSSWSQEVCGLIRESISSDESSWPQGVCWSIGESTNSNKGSWLQQVCSLIRESICSDNSFWSQEVCRLVKSFRLQGVC